VDVDIAREPHFSDQPDPSSGNAGAIRERFDGKLKMWRFNRTAYLFSQFSEEP
jgi:hypothetical protein